MGDDALCDSQALQRFARIELDAEGVPDATTLLKFRRLLETHDLCKALFTAIDADLAAHAACYCAKARWSTPRSLPRRPRPRTPTSNAIRRCTRPRRATSGISD